MKRHFNLLASVLLVIAMVFALASCDLIDKIIPGNNQPDPQPEHEHAYVDGSCECGEADPNYVAPHEHNFVEGKCECGETDPNYTVPECAEHAYGAPEVTKEATCTEAGEKKFTCTVCGYSKTQEIAPNGHTEEDIPGKAATCTEAGLSTGSQCTVCGTVTEEQVSINPKGHSFVEGACSACGEADPEYNGPKTYSFHFSDVVAGADKDAIAEGTTYADGYFTIVGTVTQRVKDGAVYCVEVAKNGTGAIQFTVIGTATVEVQFSSTGGSNTSKVGLFDADGNLVANNEGITEVTGASAGMTVVTYNLTAGTYTVVSPASNVDAGETDYNRGARVFYVNVTETPAEEVEVPEIKVETTDTYGWFDEYSFTANAEGYYTFAIPAGLGFCSKAQFDKYAAPELDYQKSPNGGDVVVGLKEGETLVFYVGALTKGNWTITWSFEAGEVEDGPVGPSVEIDTELEVGVNSIYITGGFGATVDCTFAVTEEGTYTFASGNLMAVITMDDGTQLRGQAYLVPGTYSVTIVSYASMDGYYDINVQFAAPVTGEPNGSEEFPYIWDTIPESVVVDYDVITGKVYYIFTATADGTITFTWPVEGDSWYDIFELDANGNTTSNNASGGMKTSHSFMVEAGKSYRVSLGSWAEAGSHTIAISFVSCNHVWSEATCTAPSTCENCGATTGSKAEHTSTVANPTCANPDICAVCEMELSYIPHEFDDGVVTTPADCATGTEGSITYTCTVCGGTQVDTLYAYHEWVVDVENYATCTENGRYEAHCSVCNKVDAYDIEAQGHYNWYATCGDTTTCMECGGEFTLEHAGSEATCTEPMYCYNCWQFVGEPLGHNYSAVVTAPTCSAAGYTTYTCENCSDSYTADETAALEHDYDHVVTAPTCTAAGYTTHTCAFCDYSYTDTEVAATGHSYNEGVCSSCGASDPNYYAPVTAAEAKTLADGKKVQLTGVVISAEAWNTQYKNMSLTIKDENGDTFYVYRLSTQVGLGDTITIKGVIGSYNDEKQIAQGGTAVINVVHGDNHTYANGACTVCGTKEPVVGETTVKCDFSTVSGTQYADETKTFGDVTVSTHNKGCHFNSQLRIYDSSTNNGWAIVTAGKTVSGLKVNAGYKAATLNVYGSVDGETWVLIQAVSTSTSYKDYTVSVDSAAGYKYIKLDASGAQIRVASLELTYLG